MTLNDDTRTKLKSLPFLETDAFEKQQEVSHKSPTSNTQGFSSDYWTMKSNHYFNPDIAENSRIKYKVINELKEGDYFGEISLLSNLRVTSTIVAT